MPDLKLTGYFAAATAIVWTSGQALNSATDNMYTAVSDEVDNSTNLYAFVDLEIVLASAAFAGLDSGIEIFIIPTQDGTNYPTWTGAGTADAQANNPFFVGFAPTTGATAAQRAVTTRLGPLPEGKYKWAFRNRGNVTLAASGNSASWRPHSFKSV